MAFIISLTAFVFAAVAMAWIKTVYHHNRMGLENPNVIAVALSSIFAALGLVVALVRTELIRPTRASCNLIAAHIFLADCFNYSRSSPCCAPPGQAVVWMTHLFSVDKFHESRVVARCGRNAAMISEPLRTQISGGG